ncbi:Telomerase reverse transcriptase [Colletotrichum tanaceti]|uniref:Telomerase reverse transcriptase n=1 Tax=Colletotrichum tanaceti TaxID=1306861 RepID=A0A4U6XLP7_9PEZI|nr:Telomerase reverse transcriptase [Colletotrichum tanaceti]TKW56565.1 Telomerase reverse transcriptase [Colletotrichum tanaceti]
MVRKRKERSLGGPGEKHPERKRARLDRTTSRIKYCVLPQCYDNVQTLREFLLSKLPGSSRLRRKKISLLGKGENRPSKEGHDYTPELVVLLDTTLVCTHHRSQAQSDSRWEQWRSFSQKADESVISASGNLASAAASQSEIVDFAVWQLFSRIQPYAAWPKHLLCDGFKKRAENVANGNGRDAAGPIPGLVSVQPNHSVQSLKETPWPQTLMLLGKSGEQIMIDLLIDTAVFLPVKAGIGNLHQLSGIPILESGMSVGAKQSKPDHSKGQSKPVDAVHERLSSEITFVRNRMLYARAALTTKGTVHYGLRHIHALSRFPYVSPDQASEEEKGTLAVSNERNTLKVMMYIFPRQFGLHNVFTSAIDYSKTSQRFADYTLREEEISTVFKEQKVRLPKRLRGDAKRLVERLQLLHGRCAYAELLRHYCPTPIDLRSRTTLSKKATKPSSKLHVSQVPGSRTPQTEHTGIPSNATQSRHKSRQPALSLPVIKFDAVTELATSASHVSAYCQAVLARVIPNEFWGSGDDQIHNKNLLLKKVDHFVRIRRFESMTLNELADGMRVTSLAWLAPPALKGQKTSQTDMKKRLEILNEFLYYVFDSLLIPLLRSNFYITESSSHRYRLFYFRHDIWRYVAEPAMAALRTNMFEEVKLDQATRVLDSRRLGFSRIRLLPKGKTMRPITNLRRRTVAKGKGTILGPSINSVLGPVHSMLRLETERNPSKLGSSMFSVGNLYPRLHAFSASFGNQHPKFYFAKVDVQSAFDTIPQAAVIRLMEDIPSEKQYIIKKHVEVKAALLDSQPQKHAVTKLTRRWHSIAVTPNDTTDFAQLVESRLGKSRKNTVFVGNTMRRQVDIRELMELMTSHIKQNLVKVGKKFYRQKRGIPQGSVLSSALCNYFYADLEARHLSFLAAEDCLLLRLIDDFLLITTDPSKAHEFVEVMHGGLPEYGVAVNPKKTLVNFGMAVDGMSVARLPEGSRFPYCGLGIDCNTLDIVKDREHFKDGGKLHVPVLQMQQLGDLIGLTVVSNALTIDYGNKPGQNFQRRVLNAFKIQSHLMFYDTKHNAMGTVMSNLHKAFAETTGKMWAYWRCLPPGRRPADRLIMQTVTKVIDAAFVLLTSQARREKYPEYACDIEKTHVAWLALDAVRKVLARKQANFASVLSWIDTELGKLDPKQAARAMKHIR